MSDFWYRVRRGRCRLASRQRNQISTCTRFLLTFVNSATVVEKSQIICHRISRISWISIRDSYAASVKRERLFSQSKESLQGTTSFNLALQHRSQRDRKLKADNPLGPSTLRQCTWSSVRALTYGTINIVTAFFQRGEVIDHWRCLI